MHHRIGHQFAGQKLGQRHRFLGKCQQRITNQYPRFRRAQNATV